jgi:hypothetical protein
MALGISDLLGGWPEPRGSGLSGKFMGFLTGKEPHFVSQDHEIRALRRMLSTWPATLLSSCCQLLCPFIPSDKVLPVSGWGVP